MAITPRQLDIKGAYIQDAYAALESEILKMLIKSLKTKTSVELDGDTAWQWQLDKMNQLGMMNMQTVAELTKQAANVSRKQLEEMILRDGYQIGTEANQEFANLMNVDVKPWTNLDQILNGYLDSQWLDLDNHVNQTLISTNYNSPIGKAYQQVLNDTVAKVITGIQTPNKAFYSSVYAMVDKGLETDFIDKGGNPWSVERYVRTVIKSTTQRVFNDLRLERSKEYGIVTALVSTHAAAREQCSHIQGGWVLMVPTAEAPEELQYIKSIYDYGYGTPSGTRGINCSHRFYPAVPGVNKNNMPEPPTPEEAQANAEIVAKQRRLEVAVRKAKQSLSAAETLGDKEGIERFSQLIRKRQGAIRELISKNESLLHRDYSREFVHD